MAIATLADLLAPAPEQEFREKLRRREIGLWRKRDRTLLASLLNWPALDRLIASGTFPPAKFRVTRQGTPVHSAFFERDGRLDAARIRQLLDQGASLILSPLDGHIPPLDALAGQVRQGTRDRVLTGVIVTTGSGGALAPHFDPEDILVMQIEGTKHWRIHPVPVKHAVRGMPAGTPPDGEFIEQTLEPGDLMLVPAGYWHSCQNGPGRSTHLGLSFIPPSLTRAAERLFARLLADEAARAPLTRGEAPASALDEASIKARLADEIARMSLHDLIGNSD